MTLLVKICGFGDEETLQAAVNAGVDAVGFVFYEKSPRNLTPERAAKLASIVPSTVLRVAVTLHPEASLWNEVADALRPNVLQTDFSDFSYLDVDSGITRWPVLREGSALLQGQLPDTFVYEGTRSGQGQTVDWNSAAAIARQGDMILAGGLTTANVVDAVRTVRPFGVDVSSAVESAPGKKDVGLITKFVSVARVADLEMSERNDS